MIFPEFLKPGDTIGVTAPSAGVVDEADVNGFYAAKKNLEERGYKVIFTDNVFKDAGHGVSSDKLVRAKKFMELVTNKEVKYICSAKGGDLLMEILPYLDFEVIKNNPKWIQGYSDNTNLTMPITTKCDIATVYGNNFGAYGMEEWHKSIIENIELLEGKIDTQENFELFEADFREKITGLEGYNLTEKVNIFACMGDEKVNEASFSGRVIGGCMDVVLDLLGTKYEDSRTFCEKYKEDGVVWYLESFLNNSEGVIRNLWKMKEMGYFEYVKGFIFGRELFYNNYSNTEFYEACMMILRELKVPVIFGADIGHRAPSMTMINGARYDVEYFEGKLKLKCKEI